MKILIIMLLSLYGGIRGDRGFLDWEGYKGREINMNVILGGYLRFPYANLNLFFNYSSYSLSHSGNRITFYSFPAGGIELCAGKFPFFIGGEVSYGECRGWKINELSLETTKFYRSYTGKFLIIFKQTDHFDFFLNLFYKKIPDFENFNAYGISIGAFLRAPRTPKIKLETAETFPALLSFWQQKKPEGELYLAISNIGQKTVED